MRMNYRKLPAAFVIAASLLAGGVNAAASDDLAAFEGRWNGRLDLACTGTSASMEVVIQNGDMNGQADIRGAGEGSGIYKISGYVDRKGRVSDGRMQGYFGLSMRGNL